MKNDQIESFALIMEAAHNKRPPSLSKYYMESMDVDEAWELWAKTVQDALKGANPQELMKGMVDVANTAMYVHNMLEREDSKSVVRKLAEARKARMGELNVRKVDK